MKKIFFFNLIVIATVGIILFSSCIKEHVTGITLNKSELILESGETETLIAIVQPENATNKRVMWESSNPAVATVNNNGLVTAIKMGDVIITANTNEGNKKATCAVKVQNYRAKWIGEYEGILLQRKDLDPIDTTFPCRIYVTPEPSCVEPPNPMCDSSVCFKLVSPAYLLPPTFSCWIQRNGTFIQSKWIYGRFYQDSIYVKEAVWGDDKNNIGYNNYLYAKK
jgi:hypothetical protein